MSPVVLSRDASEATESVDCKANFPGGPLGWASSAFLMLGVFPYFSRRTTFLTLIILGQPSGLTTKKSGVRGGPRERGGVYFGELPRIYLCLWLCFASYSVPCCSCMCPGLNGLPNANAKSQIAAFFRYASSQIATLPPVVAFKSQF